MNIYYQNPKKILFFAVSFAFIIIILISELLFGKWFTDNKSNNLCILQNVKLKFKTNTLYDSPSDYANYTRDKYGLRGNYKICDQINVLTVGGSTTDQRYIDDTLTWQYLLQDKFHSQKQQIIIGNAGIDGQTTFGHIKNFDWWFPYVPGLKPKYIFFYVGINDFMISHESEFDYLSTLEGRTNLPYLIKSNSLFYSIYNKLKMFYKNRATFSIVGHYRVDFALQKWTKKPINNIPDSLIQKYVNLFEYRLKILIKKANKFNSLPIFITQPARTYKFVQDSLFGIGDTLLFKNYLVNGIDYYNIISKYNKAIKNVCKQNNVLFVDVFSSNNWEDSDFYDYVHMNPKGTKKLAQLIFDGTKSLFYSFERGQNKYNVYNK